MKILHIITGLGNGGAEGVLHRLTTACADQAHEVISLTGHGWTSDKLIKSGIPVHAIDLRSFKQGGFAGLARLRGLIRESKPDVIQTWMYHADLLGGVAARLGGRKSIVWGVRASQIGVDRSSASARRVRWACARLSNIIPKLIVCNSEAGARVHERLGYQREKLVVISNGYDLDELWPDREARAEVRRAWGCLPDEPLLGMVARWDVLKDHENLVEALAILKGRRTGWRCVLIGPGISEHNPQLVKLLARHDLQDRVLLQGPTTRIRAVMSAIDVHTLSSRAEAFPNAVAEAMACGTPCVVTDVGDAAQIVGQTGWSVPASDPKLLARALADALAAMSDRAGWAERQNASRRRIGEFYNLTRVADEYRAVWHAATA